jgi:hypothetical protein
MINCEFNILLHSCLDSIIDEISIIDLIEKFCIDKTLIFCYLNHINNTKEVGIISQKFYHKLQKKSLKNKILLNQIRFFPNNHYPFLFKYFHEKEVKIKCLKTITPNKYLFLTRKLNIIHRLYYNSSIDYP